MSLKVTILGCGLSGMISALFYANRGIYCTIIEPRLVGDQSFFTDIRTTALTAHSKELFVQNKIWPAIEAIAGPIKEIYVADNKAINVLHFISPLPNEPIIGYLVENSKFGKALFNLVQHNPYVNIIDQTQYHIVPNSTTSNLLYDLLLNNQIRHQADIILVCDGKNSHVRRQFFTPLIEKLYPQSALTFIIEHQYPHHGIAIEHFMPTGPLALLPLKSPNHSSIVWTVDRKTGLIIQHMSQEERNYLIQQHMGSFLGKIKTQINCPIALFPLQAYITKQYFHHNIALTAESSHIIHPLAGQGLNQGIKDIEAVTKLSCLSFDHVSDILLRYEQSRKQDNLNMFRITDYLNHLFSNNSSLLHQIRQAGFKAIEALPIKDIIIKYGMGKR